VRRRLLLVHPNDRDRKVFAECFASAGFVVHLADDRETGWRRFRVLQPDIVVLELDLPDGTGLDLCREIRALSQVPLILVTDRDEEFDVVVALEVGADAYVVKPCRPKEIVLRAMNLLARVAPAAEERFRVREGGGVRVDPGRPEVTCDGRPVPLSRKELDLLCVLMDQDGRVVGSEEIIDRVWGSQFRGDPETLKVHFQRLRSKLREASGGVDHLISVRSVGYRFVVADKTPPPTTAGRR
jgi:two-component system response regulator RegX3